MFKQHSEGKEVLVAQIINEFENVEEQNEAALLFSSNLKAVNNDEDVTDFRTIDASEKELYLNQLVRQVKLYSIDYKLRNTTDLEVLKQCTMEKANIMKLHIVL
ncbi:MAG: hypothetical protein K6G26_14105 [Lachnospiraceae bacterium]|nr:hypothetical protein [Lachnospiraceae bacterium]